MVQDLTRLRTTKLLVRVPDLVLVALVAITPLSRRQGFGMDDGMGETATAHPQQICSSTFK